jgi:hypothetical protein
MKSKRHHKKVKKNKKTKRWTTAVDAAQSALKKTGSLSKARTALRLQAYQNARKLFGSVSEKK